MPYLNPPPMASDRTFERFYVLVPGRGSASDTEFFKSEPITRGEAPKCATCGRFLGMRRWMSPHHAQVVVHGERPGDFAFASSSEFLVSEVAMSAIRDEGLTGLNDLEEVEISSTLRAESAEPGRYFYGEITQQGADLDPRGATSNERHHRSVTSVSVTASPQFGDSPSTCRPGQVPTSSCLAVCLVWSSSAKRFGVSQRSTASRTSSLYCRIDSHGCLQQRPDA